MRSFLVLSLLSAALGQFVSVGYAGQGAPSGFVKYPGYTGPLTIDGTVSFEAEGLSHNVTVNLTGAEANGNVSIHIHSGVSCQNASGVGGHLWTPFADVDPWAVVSLPADASGNVAGSFPISFGYDKTDFIRHALVIHNSTGARVACAIIHDENRTAVPAVLTAGLDTYPGYNGTLVVRGEINVWDVAGAQLQVNYRLTGLTPNSTGGLHVHVGFECNTSGAHYWLPANETDPWANLSLAHWESNSLGGAEGTFHLAVGLNQLNVTNRAIVVHDSDTANTRAACGLLGGRAPTAAPTAAPTSANNTNTSAPTPSGAAVAQPVLACLAVLSFLM